MPTSAHTLTSTLTRLALATLAALLATLTIAGQADAAKTARLVQGGGGQAGASIIGGYYPHASQWPWMAALLDKTRGNGDFTQQVCGGALVHARLVVTAAHCVDDASAANLQVLLGKRRLSAAGGEHIQVSKISIHPSYTSAGLPDNDVALLYLSGPSNQTPAPLLSQGTTLYQGNIVTSMGWGRVVGGDHDYDYDSEKSDDLKAIDSALWSASNCQRAGRDARDQAFYSRMNTATQICAGYSDSAATTCNGDSGSPMMIPDTAGQWRLVGVISWGGIGCGGGYSPTVAAWLGGSLQSFVSQGIAQAANMGSSTVTPPRDTVTPPRPAGIRLSAGLKAISVRRGRSLRINVNSSGRGTLRIKVLARGRSRGIWEAPVSAGRNTILQPTKNGRRKFKRGVYRMHLSVQGAGGTSNAVKLGFRVR